LETAGGEISLLKAVAIRPLTEIFTNDPLFLFEKWYQVLDSLGIRQIDGNIVAYDGLFDDVPYPRGWEWDDLSYYYAPEINALSFNSNVVNLEVIADGEVGGTPQIQWYPFNTPYVDFVNEQVITPRTTRYNESYQENSGNQYHPASEARFLRGIMKPSPCR
jgi:serine-type D-Ala-D-Ala carboxypeptidase/endopeptidase (penicillin-binding protein 4)